jgi:hypothetical protein
VATAAAATAAPPTDAGPGAGQHPLLLHRQPGQRRPATETAHRRKQGLCFDLPSIVSQVDPSIKSIALSISAPCAPPSASARLARPPILPIPTSLRLFDCPGLSRVPGATPGTSTGTPRFPLALRSAGPLPPDSVTFDPNHIVGPQVRTF